MLERVHCWWECKLIQPVWKTAWRFLKKLKIEQPYDPGIPLLGIYHEKKNLNSKRHTHCDVYCSILYNSQGFPDSSVGKESTCNAGDLGSIPKSGRSTGEGIGYPLQHSRASLVAQLVKKKKKKIQLQ